MVWITTSIASIPVAARAELEAESGDYESSLGEFGLPDWIPSIGVGAGVQARDGEASFGTLLRSDTPGTNENSYNCRNATVFGVPNPFTQSCDFVDDSEDTVDGASLPLSLQLLGPSLDDLPFGLRLRPLLHGGYSWNYSRRILAEAGNEVVDFDGNGQEPDLRVEVEAENVSFWWSGAGIAVQLPLERPAFLKIAANYHEQDTRVFSRIDRRNTLATTRVREKDTLTIRGIGPSIGLEAEVARAGPLSFGVSADFLLTIPLSGADEQYQLSQQTLLSPFELSMADACAPGEVATFQDFCFDNFDTDVDLDNPFYFGSVQVRVSWIGW
jgi:hypothetical protein